jgi:hypothetical protein
MKRFIAMTLATQLLCVAPIASAANVSAEDRLAAGVQEAMTEVNPRSQLSDSQLAVVEDQVAQILAEHTPLNGVDQEVLQQQIMNLVAAANSGNVGTAFDAAQRLQETLQGLAEDQQSERSLFDAIGAVINLITAVQSGDIIAIVQSIIEIVKNLFQLFD